MALTHTPEYVNVSVEDWDLIHDLGEDFNVYLGTPCYGNGDELPEQLSNWREVLTRQQATSDKWEDR